MDWIARIMDWYFDFLILASAFFVIAVGMTIYVRIHPIRSRFKYVYTGIIPTITITTCEDMPNPPLPPPSEETSDTDESSNDHQEDSTNSACEESSNISHSSEQSQTDSLQVPVLDDDYDDDEETVQVVEIETLPLTESKTDETQNVTVCPPDSPVLERKENIVRTSASDDNLIGTIQKIDDEAPNKESCFVNGFTWKYGTSHTMEDPLFPFSEAFEEEKPLTKNRFKKRLSE